MNLLDKRYLVIADYLFSPYKIGDVIQSIDADHNSAHLATINQIDYFYDINDCALYPALFRELQWWEMREESEMPMYLKLVIDDKIQYVHKVEKWVGKNDNGQPLYEYINKVGYQSTFYAAYSEPATLKEYSQYIKSK